MAIKYKKKYKPVQVDIVPEKKVEKQQDPTVMPNTFKFAAESLKLMSERGGSAGSIVVNKYKSYNVKHIYALVMKTLKNIKIIKKIIHNQKLMSSLPSSDNPFLVEVLIGELLFGRGLKSIEQTPLAAAILSRKENILKEHNELKKEFSASSQQAPAKYLRINTMKSDIKHVIAQLIACGLTQLEYAKDKIKFKKFVNKYKSMDDDNFMIDFHFPQDLILVKPAALKKIKRTDLLKKCKATFQDKASFMAVEALEAQPGQNIIDACFAPGCKTSLIVSKMHNKGKVLAYDVDKKRLVSAIHLLKLQGATCVKTELQDFSKVKLNRLPKIHKINAFDSILLDPSCSGSGIQARLDYKRTADEAGRLKKLQAFQVSLLKHALRARISKTIVYCTCSTSVEENEQAIQMALEESGAAAHWQIVDVIPFWPLRGKEEFDFGSKCLRSDAENLTNGFFIAKLECKMISNSSEESSEPKLKKMKTEVKVPKKKNVPEEDGSDDDGEGSSPDGDDMSEEGHQESENDDVDDDDYQDDEDEDEDDVESTSEFEEESDEE